MQVVLLGTGCPVVHPDRGGAATLFSCGGTSVLVDCGSGVTQRLLEAGTPGSTLDALLLTHLHSDHLVDLYQLIVSSWHQGRERPWTVYAPAPVIRHVRAIMSAWEEERAQRVAFEGRPAAGLEIELHELAAGDLLEIGDLAIEAVEVEHTPVVPAFGFVFRGAGTKVVHSGDTARCEALIRAGRDADLLIHEVYLHPRNEGQRRTASYHTLSSDVGGVARDMAAKALALTHFVPPVFDRAALVAEVAEDFGGPIFVGEDLMRFDLATGCVSWGDFFARSLS